MKKQVVYAIIMIVALVLFAVMIIINPGETVPGEAVRYKKKIPFTKVPADSNLSFRRNRLIGKGMNFGNALEAPREGDWGLTIRKSYIKTIAKAGFNSVRLPVCWPAHTDSVPPYSIDPVFLKRVDRILGWCFRRNMAVVITIHHFNKLYEEPLNDTLRQTFFSIWKQLSTHYLGTEPDRLIFELLNEPHGNLTPERWNELIPEVLQAVRKIDTNRTLILDVPDWAFHENLPLLKIPDKEQNVIVSTRYYLPYDFTHQGAHWVKNSNQWSGSRWTGTEAEKAQVRKDMKFVTRWAQEHNRPITIGEYGAIINAPENDRVTWTRYVRSQFEANHFSWSYFDFGVTFRVYDIRDHSWLKGFPEAFFK